MAMCFPGDGIENEARVLFSGEIKEALEIPCQCRAALRVGQQSVRGEFANLNAMVEDQIGLDPRIGKEDVARQLR